MQLETEHNVIDNIYGGSKTQRKALKPNADPNKLSSKLIFGIENNRQLLTDLRLEK